MARHQLRRLGIGAAYTTTLLLLAGCPLETEREPTTVVAQSAADAPIVIAVLADHFTRAERADFDDAVENLFRYGLLSDPDYAGHAKDIAVVPIFQAWTPTAETPRSNYGFEVTRGSTNCSVTWTADTGRLIEAALGHVDPFRTVVVGNYGYNFGCADGEWTYVSTGAVGRKVLEHEFGHLLAGLYDEYHVAALAGQRHPAPLECRNCSTNATAPHWQSLGCGDITNRPSCDLYGLGIVHPSDNCRMGAPRSRFCCVCKREIESAFTYFDRPEGWTPDVACAWTGPELTRLDLERQKPTTMASSRFAAAGLLVGSQAGEPARPSVQLVRVLVTLSRGAVAVRRINDSTGVFTPAHRRLSAFVYEVSDAGRTIATGVLSGDPLLARDYRGGGQRHEVAPTPSADIVVRIPGETIAKLRGPGRSVQIAFYRLNPLVRDPLITPAVLERLKLERQADPIAAIASDTLFRAMP